jgi:hypothetical protein
MLIPVQVLPEQGFVSGSLILWRARYPWRGRWVRCFTRCLRKQVARMQFEPCCNVIRLLKGGNAHSGCFTCTCPCTPLPPHLLALACALASLSCACTCGCACTRACDDACCCCCSHLLPPAAYCTPPHSSFCLL